MGLHVCPQRRVRCFKQLRNKDKSGGKEVLCLASRLDKNPPVQGASAHLPTGCQISVSEQVQAYAQLGKVGRPIPSK